MTLKTDVAAASSSTSQENQQPFPGVEVERVFLRKYPYQRSGRTCSARRRGHRAAAQGPALLGRGARRPRRAVRHRVPYDRYLRGKQRRQPHPGRRARPPAGRAGGAATRCRASSCGCRSTSACRRRASRRSRPPVSRRLRRDGLAQRRGARARLQPELRPERVREGLKQSVYKRLPTRTTARRSPTARRRACYPTGSTFKLITATAALAERADRPRPPLFDGGSLKVGGVTFKNAGGVVARRARAAGALQVSADVFFYRLGSMADQRGDD